MIAKNNDWNYEVTVARVEDALEAIESGELGLVEIVAQLKVIAFDMQQCEEFLVEIQGRTGLLVETLGD